MKSWLLATSICLAVLVGGCAELTPYRTELPPPLEGASAACDPDLEDPMTDGGSVGAACARRIREDASRYRLYFAEFDDQGWAYPAVPTYGESHRQLDLFTSELKSLILNSSESISVVVFVHGWKHTARSDDTNVTRFRQLLQSLDLVEQATGCRRRVIGLYVGWRGAATTLGDPLENLTFYNRKDAAERVALGDVRGLFSTLRAQQDLANRKWNAQVVSSLEAAESAASAASEAPLPHYHAPLFVAITSSDDEATRKAFPAGRTISTLWEKYAESPDGRQKRANTTTLGQDDDFITHRLSAAPYPPSPTQATTDGLDIDGYDAKNSFPRTFCSTQLLTLTGDDVFGPGAANSPVWNVRTSSPIVNDHNDFSNPHLIAFFRQLYREAEFRDDQVARRAR